MMAIYIEVDATRCNVRAQQDALGGVFEGVVLLNPRLLQHHLLLH